MSVAAPERVARPRRRIAVLVTAGTVLLAVAAYLVGRQQPVVHQESVSCLSAGTISCDLSDGSTIGVPRDVPWTGVDGAFRDHGRPACLPPTGIGEEGPVRLSWVETEVDGVGWRSVVHVDCRG